MLLQLDNHSVHSNAAFFLTNPLRTVRYRYHSDTVLRYRYRKEMICYIYSAQARYIKL